MDDAFQPIGEQVRITYEVHVSERHWLEGCDITIQSTVYRHLDAPPASQCCPVFRAMAEAGVPVLSVYPYGWFALDGTGLDVQRFTPQVQEAVSHFDGFRAGDNPYPPPPITFYVVLEA